MDILPDEKTLCPTCANSIRCPTWAEWKCKAKEKRIYNYKSMTECNLYKARDKNFKEPRCQCKDCFENELVLEGEENYDGVY